jgi:hypothetical protein
MPELRPFFRMSYRQENVEQRPEPTGSLCRVSRHIVLAEREFPQDDLRHVLPDDPRHLSGLG